MAKKTNKLELVEKTAGNLAVAGSFITQLPDKNKLKRISSAQLIKPAQVPMNATVSGVVTGLTRNLGKSTETKNAYVINFHHIQSDRHFMFPMTGTMKQAMLPYLNVDSVSEENEKGKMVEVDIYTLKPGKEGLIGKTLFLTRREDGKAKRYGGNRMFNFDVDIAE